MRISRVLMLIMLIALIVVPASAAGQEETASEEVVTVRFWCRGVNDVATKMIQEEMIPAFEADNPGIKAEFRPLTWQNNYAEIDTAIAAGDAPDVMSLGRPSALKYAAAGALLDIDQRVRNWAIYDDFYPYVWTDSTNMEGEIVSIPAWLDVKPYVYNKRLFREAGLDPNNFPDTWEELLDAAVALTKYDDKGNVIQAGMSLAFDDFISLNQRYMNFLWQNGGSLLDPNDWKKSAMNSPQAVEALEFLVDLYNKYEIDNYAPWGAADMYQKFANGEAGIFVAATFGIRDIIANPELKNDLGIGLPPMRVQRATGVLGTDFGISADTSDPDKTWAFVDYLYTQGDYLARMDREIGWQPPPLKSAKDAFISEAPEVLGVIYDTLEYGKNWPPIPENLELRKLLGTAIEKTLYGQMSAQEALDEAAAAADKILAKAEWEKNF